MAWTWSFLSIVPGSRNPNACKQEKNWNNRKGGTAHGGCFSGTASKHNAGAHRIDAYLRCCQTDFDAYQNALFLQSSIEDPEHVPRAHRCAWRASTNAFVRHPLSINPSKSHWEQQKAQKEKTHKQNVHGIVLGFGGNFVCVCFPENWWPRAPQ